jgi:hypothetical protein
MHYLYLIPNKPEHDGLITKIFGVNPLKYQSPTAIMLWCPGDSSQDKVLNSEDELYENTGPLMGYLKDEYSGRVYEIQ